MSTEKQQPEALRLAECLDDGHCSLRNALHPAAAELRRLHAENEVLHDQCLKSVMVISVLEDEIEAMRKAVSKLHAAKGRYHTQLAACDLYDLLGLKNERPTK